MNLRIVIKNHAADSKIAFLVKSVSKPNGCAKAMPTAWELKSQNFAKTIFLICDSFLKVFSGKDTLKWT